MFLCSENIQTRYTESTGCCLYFLSGMKSNMKNDTQNLVFIYIINRKLIQSNVYCEWELMVKWLVINFSHVVLVITQEQIVSIQLR